MKAKHCTLGHVLGVLLVLCGSLFLGCTNENDLSGDQNDGTDPGRIATLEDQAASIEASIRDLEEVYEKHEELIEKLSTEVSGLEDLLDALESSGAYEDPTETQAYKELKERYSSLQNAKSLLSEKIDSLETGIAKLQEYVDGELKSSEDWVGSTFATLEKYNEVQENLSSIDALVKKNEGDISAINESINDLGKAIAKAEESMKSWVNETLADGYYTKAEIDGKITVLQTQVTEGDAALQNLAAALTQAENDLRAAYKKAIEDAITDNGIISAEIAAAVKTAQDILQEQIGVINSEIEKINERLDAIETDINSINEQITAIKGSIDTLKVVDADLKGYIESLRTTAADLQSQIDATNTEIENVKKEMGDEIYAVEQSLLNKLDNLKATLEGELATIKANIETLKDKDTELEGRIAALETYVDTQLQGTKDWANATFATLAQYEEIQGTIDGIKGDIAAINTAIANLETRINEKIATDIKAGIDALRTELGADYAAKIDAVTSAYTAAIATAKGDIEAEYTEAIKKEITEAEESIKSWVNETLAESYYTKKELDRKITDLQKQVTEDDDALQKEIDDLAADIAQAESDLTAAIKEAIENNKGKISEDIASPITVVYTYFESRLDEIESRLSGVEQRVDEILAMIQSVTYMPEYSDGAAYVGIFSRTLEMSFKLSPSSVVASLKEVWESSLSVKFLTTKSTKAAPVMKDLSIKSAEFDETIGTVTVTVDCSNLAQSFYTGETSASASLFISDGHSNVSSDFVPLVLNVDVPSLEAANCYIVSESGCYQFRSAKGNSLELLSDVESAEVLWESFGTDVTPEEGDLVSAALYRDGNIYFKTADTFKEGNAVIAAKDASGKILWSWHIWLTDQPEEQVYYNNAGTMMDRNLGATSATPGDVGALGLFYQWGRKDPFLGSSSISENIEAKSTITWPSTVFSDSSTGTIDYVVSHPTAFVHATSPSFDWHYSLRDNTFWTTSDKAKSVYDPCPAGWRIPDGTDNDIWAYALGYSNFNAASHYNITNRGVNFSDMLGPSSNIWYPASGQKISGGDGISKVGFNGEYWSTSDVNEYYMSFLSIPYNAYGNTTVYSGRWVGRSVRCIKEGTGGGSSDSGDSNDSNVQKETIRFESVTYDWTLQRAFDLRGDNNEPYAMPIIRNSVRYDNIYNLESFLRDDSGYQITKTVKCGDQIVDPSVITIQNISPPTAGRQGSADIVLSGYEFGDTENTYSFEILASNDDLELRITGSIMLGALPETVVVQDAVDLYLVSETTYFQGRCALIEAAYANLGAAYAGFPEDTEKLSLMYKALNDDANTVINNTNSHYNINLVCSDSQDKSWVCLYESQYGDYGEFVREIDTWFGVNFRFVITVDPILPKNTLVASADYMKDNAVELRGEIINGVYTIDLADLGRYFTVDGEIENKLKVQFDILEGDVILAANEVEVNSLGELDRNKAIVNWADYAGAEVKASATLIAEDCYPIDLRHFFLKTADPLTFDYGVLEYTQTGTPINVKAFSGIVVTSAAEPEVTNLLNQNASSLEDVFAESKADITYGLEVECDLLKIYTYDSQGSKERFPQASYEWDRKSGVLTLLENPTGRIVYAEIRVSFLHQFLNAYNNAWCCDRIVRFIP